MKDRGAQIGQYQIIDGTGYFVLNKSGTLTKIGKALPWWWQFYFALKKNVTEAEVREVQKKHNR
jgi:hypothetical protein